MPTQVPDTLVDVDWLKSHLDDPNLVVLDCSVLFDPAGGGTGSSGRGLYDSGHIPGAHFADLTDDLSDPDSDRAYALPQPEAFCIEMERLGIGDESTVVLYDRSTSFWAARVWWMLRWIGFDRAALLDGGLGAWTEAGNPLSLVEPEPSPGKLGLNVRPELIADRTEVLEAIEDEAVCIIDTFTPDHYRGEWSRYERAGHIPSAVNLAATSMYGPDGRLLPLDELEAMHPGERDARTVTYCGGGVMASASAFVLNRLGFSDVAVYIGSLREWVSDDSLPMATSDGGVSG